jgi:hypothetical protein
MRRSSRNNMTILSAAGQLEKATEHFESAIKHDPYDAQYRLDLGQVLLCHTHVCPLVFVAVCLDMLH